MWGVVLLLLTTFAFGATSREFIVKSKNGETFEVRAFYYKNKNGSQEIRLESPLLPRVSDKINSIYGYGRDLDDDEIIDNWFLVDPNGGMIHIEQNCHTKLCKKTIVEKLFLNYEKSEMMVFYSAYATVVGFFFMSLDNRYEKEMDFYKEWIDLEEFRIRLERDMQSKNPVMSKDQHRLGLEMLIHGYEQNRILLEKANGIDVWKYLAVDVGVAALGVGVFNLLEKSFAYLGAKATSMAISSGFKNFIKKFTAKQFQIVNNRLSKVKGFAKVTAAQASSRNWTNQTFKKAFRGGLASIKLKTKFLKRYIPFIKKSADDGKSFRWSYVAMSSGIQIGAETTARWDEVQSDDPREVAENVLSNKEVQQNVAYMLTETFFMTTAVTFAKTLKMKYAICGMVALTNSVVVNFMMKDSADHERVLSDTAWEMGVGSSQVILDDAAIGYFEALAKKMNNPHIKFLGWAVAVVDQAAGYYVYSKVSSNVEEHIADRKAQSSEGPMLAMVPLYVLN